MKFPQSFLSAAMAAGIAVPAVAQTQTLVASPTNGNVESSPFEVLAGASTCDSNPVAYIGYSVDNSSYMVILAGFESCFH